MYIAYQCSLEKMKHLEPKSLKIIVGLLENTVFRRNELLQLVGLTNHTDNVRKYLEPLFKLKIIEYTIKDNPKSEFQRYMLTGFGRKIANLPKEGLENANEKINN